MRGKHNIVALAALLTLTILPGPMAGLSTLAAQEPADDALKPLDPLSEEEVAIEAPYVYRGQELRDPFTPPADRRPGPEGEFGIDVPELQQHALSDFRLIGIIQSEKGYFAMVSTSDGKGYTVKVGTRIGPNRGRVRGITKDTVIVEEIYVSPFGEEQRHETILALRPEEVG